VYLNSLIANRLLFGDSSCLSDVLFLENFTTAVISRASTSGLMRLLQKYIVCDEILSVCPCVGPVSHHSVLNRPQCSLVARSALEVVVCLVPVGVDHIQSFKWH
jgi:hypothetical protein